MRNPDFSFISFGRIIADDPVFVNLIHANSLYTSNKIYFKTLFIGRAKTHTIPITIAEASFTVRKR